MIGREWYALCVGMALGAMAVYLYWRIRVDRLNPKDESKLLVAFPLMLLVGVVGAAVADALFTGDWRTWCTCGTRRFGLSFMGFLLGVVPFLACYGRMSGIGAAYLLNALLPPLALAQAIGRIGCFLGGCCYGAPCARGVSYPEGSLPYSVYGGAPLFPVQLVEAGALFLLFGVCLAIPFRRRWWVYLGGVSAIRLGLDFFRGDLPTCVGLSPQQLVAVGVLVALGVSGVRNAGRRLPPRRRRYGGYLLGANVRRFVTLVSACRGDRDGTGVSICSEQMYAASGGQGAY